MTVRRPYLRGGQGIRRWSILERSLGRGPKTHREERATRSVGKPHKPSDGKNKISYDSFTVYDSSIRRVVEQLWSLLFLNRTFTRSKYKTSME